MRFKKILRFCFKTCIFNTYPPFGIILLHGKFFDLTVKLWLGSFWSAYCVLIFDWTQSSTKRRYSSQITSDHCTSNTNALRFASRRLVIFTPDFVCLTCTWQVLQICSLLVAGIKCEIYRKTLTVVWSVMNVSFFITIHLISCPECATARFVAGPTPLPLIVTVESQLISQVTLCIIINY